MCFFFFSSWNKKFRVANIQAKDQMPNPSKVLIILEELGLPYESSWVELDGLKQKPFTDVNPNGRLPGINFYLSK